jgi:hypothetical protein
MGLAMTQAVTCQPLTTEPSPCAICSGQGGNGAGFYPSTTALLSQCQSTNASYVFTHLLLMLHNIGNWQCVK